MHDCEKVVRYLHSRGLVPEPLLVSTWQEFLNTGAEVCGQLVARGALESDDVSAVLYAARTAFPERQPPPPKASQLETLLWATTGVLEIPPEILAESAKPEVPAELLETGDQDLPLGLSNSNRQPHPARPTKPELKAKREPSKEAKREPAKEAPRSASREAPRVPRDATSTRTDLRRPTKARDDDAVKIQGGGLGRYQILGEIGQGGMGKLYRVRHPDTGVEVALKTLLRITQKGRTIERFRREALALSRFQHPNIVKIFDWGVERQGSQDLPFFVMEFVRGQDLQALVEESLRKTGAPPEPRFLATLLAAIADALCACHEMGVVHRDIKPQNILIETATQRPVLVDFGLVRIDHEHVTEGAESVESLTKTGQAVGSPAFMPPEQLFGRKDDVGPASDVWGLGATLFYGLTGQLPYQVQNIMNLF